MEKQNVGMSSDDQNQRERKKRNGPFLLTWERGL
jgi:hypothetical protein